MHLVYIYIYIYMNGTLTVRTASGQNGLGSEPGSNDKKEVSPLSIDN